MVNSVLPGDRYRREFERQIRPLLKILYRQAYRLCGQQADAEDLVQELVTRLHAKRVDLAALENSQSWLLRSLYNLFVDRLRQEKRHLAVIETPYQDAFEPDHYQSTEVGPQQEVEQHAELRRLQAALNQLNPEQRALVALHDIEGHTLQELETITGTPIGTLKSRLHRARHTLRSLLREPFAEQRRVNG